MRDFNFHSEKYMDNQDDKKTTKYMAFTFVGFAVLCVLLIIGANIIG